MPKTFSVSESSDLVIEALGPDEAERPIVYLKAGYPEQKIVVLGSEIKPLVAALTDAAVWLASEWAEVGTWLAEWVEVTKRDEEREDRGEDGLETWHYR